ncbi:hypothetical protein [Myroides odoratimimus]|nr:hypothetical protein [Myroides odoratimimus]
MHTDNGILFSPAYDLLNVNLIFPDDKEDLALTISGRKKKIQQVNFDELALNLGITEVVRNNIYKDFSRQTNKVYDLIDRSFLTNEYKEEYKRIYTDKLRQIGL